MKYKFPDRLSQQRVAKAFIEAKAKEDAENKKLDRKIFWLYAVPFIAAGVAAIIVEARAL